ncbi:MAG: ABC transporter ATP-binding protein [Lachnospiraceae bacterium]|nr:ABC transporter ATP-binding protein [Lachnospiraceae bacterium]
MSTTLNNNDVFLSVKDLFVEYSSNDIPVYAVNGVSFDLKRGKTLGLVGESGAGKTTIAKAILRVLPDIATRKCEGSIVLDGQDLLQIPEKEMLKIRGDKISMIFQDPMTALNPTQTIGEQIVEAITTHNKISTKEAVGRAVEMLRMVGITEERFNNYPFELSGGMKQRIVISIALACNPILLLADEPTTALDVTIQAQILDMIVKLRDELGTSMIMITHDLGVIAESCDDVAVVYAGEIVESGSKFDIFDHPTHPYTRGLFGSLPSMAGADGKLHPIEGLPPDPSNLPKGCSFHPRCVHATDACREGSIGMTEVSPGHFCRCIHATKEGM